MYPRVPHQTYDTPPPLHITRAVWAAVSQQPNATLAQLNRRLGLSDSMVWRALRTLRTLGYIDYPEHTRCARTIVIPFHIEEQQ